MREPDNVLLGRSELERAFISLGDRLVRRGVVADIFYPDEQLSARSIEILRDLFAAHSP